MLLTSVKEIFDKLKPDDRENRLSMPDEHTIYLKYDEHYEIILHETNDSMYFECKQDGKKYTDYPTRMELIYDELLAYMEKVITPPDQEEVNKKNGFIIFMLIVPFVILFLLYKIAGAAGINTESWDFSTVIVITFVSTWLIMLALKIGIKKLIDKNNK
ncbi:MAG: hypothetical protein IIT42_00105 [Clostridia bacterium]|nr:hypothetical protein [Clostridia bacterium]